MNSLFFREQPTFCHVKRSAQHVVETSSLFVEHMKNCKLMDFVLSLRAASTENSKEVLPPKVVLRSKEVLPPKVVLRSKILIHFVTLNITKHLMFSAKKYIRQIKIYSFSVPFSPTNSITFF